MMYSKSERGEASGERLADMNDLGQAEELALAALAKKLKGGEVAAESQLDTITDADITSRDAQRLTLNSRHNIEFLKQRFLFRFCLDGSRRVAAFPRTDVEQYMQAYLNAEPIPGDYRGRRITSFVTDAHSLTDIFGVMRDLDIPIRLYAKVSGKQITEYIDEDSIELIELALAELEPSSEDDNQEEDTWRPVSLREQLDVVSNPGRSERAHYSSIAWDDNLIEITHIPPRPKLAAPPWLRKKPHDGTLSWQPRYTRSLDTVMGASIPLARLDMRLGENATVALAAHQPELAGASFAIGVDETGAPAVAAGYMEALSALIESTEYSGNPIPDNWQTLEDVARDANVKLEGEDGLAAWVAVGSYGAEHVITVPYREVNELRYLTFCSPQLARVIVDWVLRERHRLERAIELEEKYGRPGFDVMQPMIPEMSEPLDDEVEEDGDAKEAEMDAIEELRSKLQSLETFAAQRSLEVQWVYELIHAKHDAYVVDYMVDGQKQCAHFATTEGLEYLLENLAPPEYRTNRQICDAYGIPLYLFDLYAQDMGPRGDFLSSEWCANVGLMPHYAPEQVNRILSNYYSDVAEEPMRVAEIAAKSGQTILFVSDYLARHGVVISKDDRKVLHQAGMRFIREHQEIETADEELQTPTLFLMRTREVRGCDLSHGDITTMCYELGIPLVTLENKSAKKTTQHAPTDRFPDLQAAIERYYIRSK